MFWSNKTWKKVIFFGIIESCFFVLTLVAMYGKTRDSQPQHYQNNIKGFPKQPFNTYTNLAYFYISAVTFAQISLHQWRIYFPFLNLGIAGTITGIFSTAYHCSNGYKITGDLDVASIPPYFLSIFWFITHAFMVAWKWKKQRSGSTLPLYVRSRTRFEPRPTRHAFVPLPLNDKWWILNLCIFVLQIAVFLLTFYRVAGLNWPQKFDIFKYTIIILAFISIVSMIYMTWKGYFILNVNDERKWTKHLVLLLASVCVVIFIYLYGIKCKNYQHGLHNHIMLALCIGIIVVYKTVLYRTVC